MHPSFTSPRVVIRPTLPSDTPDVLEFCKRIWDGHDYIPYVWDEWLATDIHVLQERENMKQCTALSHTHTHTHTHTPLALLPVPTHQPSKVPSQPHISLP